MAKCKKCGKELSYLHYRYEQIHYGTFFIEGGTTLFDDENDYEQPDIKFYCPDCKALLFDYTEEAEEFLKGEVEE